MKIEVGKYYKSRDGKKVGPMQSCFDLYHYDGSVGVFTESGMSLYGRDENLIAEWIDEPATGTLRELNVQVGDVVKYLGGDTPVEYTIGLISGDNYYECDDYVNELLSNDEWRIISQASPPSPVITETLTTQRIVPGVYGRVKISDSITDSSDVCLQFVNGIAFSREELTAVIATLTTVRDALTHNSAK